MSNIESSPKLIPSPWKLNIENVTPRINSLRPKRTRVVDEQKNIDIMEELAVHKTHTAILINIIDKAAENDKRKD